MSFSTLSPNGSLSPGISHAPSAHKRQERDLAISVQDLAKSYTIMHEERQTTLIHTAMARAKKPLQRVQKETFWALNGVSFDVKRGEVVGIIGRNGAGKSTLLKVLSRITEPTRGRAVLHGRVGSLLEVGTGFHPELTGRENVFLNGAILGMSRQEIIRQFDAIVDFSGTEKFLDTPVKRYSSGMYVRLAFAVAAHLNPEILIVDEVLAVGDAEFQKKCLGKMEDVAQSGRTVVVVSHNMATMNALCTSCIYMQSGSVRVVGATSDVISTYLKDLVNNRSLDVNSLRHSGMGKEIRFTGIDLVSREEGFVPLYSPITVSLSIESDIDQNDLSIGGSIFSDNGSCVGTLFSKQKFSLKRNQIKTLKLILSGSNLAPGNYYAGLSVGTGGNGSVRNDYDIVIGKPVFEVLSHSEGSDFVAEWNSSWGNIVFNDVELVEST